MFYVGFMRIMWTNWRDDCLFECRDSQLLLCSVISAKQQQNKKKTVGIIKHKYVQWKSSLDEKPAQFVSLIYFHDFLIHTVKCSGCFN